MDDAFIKAARRSLTKSQKLGILFCQRNICPGCGEVINLGRSDTVEFDHVIPLALGGADTPENMRGMHKECHTSKTKDDVRLIAKSRRIAAKHEGTYRSPRNPLPGGRNHRLKRKIGGAVVVRSTES